MFSTLQASVFICEESSENLRSIKNTGNNLSMKQMLDMSEQCIVGQSDEIYGVTTINWVDSSWKHWSLVGHEQVISLSHTQVYVFFRFCTTSLKGEREPKVNYCLGRQIEVVQKFNDISWGSEDNEQECDLSANLVSIEAVRFTPGRYSFLGLGSEKQWFSTHGSKPQGKWDGVAELLMIKLATSGHPVYRATSPSSRETLKSRGGRKLSIHFSAAGKFFSHDYFC